MVSDWSYTTNCEVPEDCQLPDSISRVAMGISYEGSQFSGWQYQDHSPSVQEALEAAISAVADEPIKTVCAGRTDTGVHGYGQVIHFDSKAVRSVRNWLLGVNTRLPADISVNWVKPVSAQFHARFRAVRRSYRYLISNTPARTAICHNGLTWERMPLDEALMDTAAQLLVGEHDFSSFRAAACGAHSPVREIYSISVKRWGSLVWLDIVANAFLHHMVRNIAGALLLIGRGEQDTDWIAQLLVARDRSIAAPTALPNGLYLTDVEYPAEFDIPKVADPLLGLLDGLS